MATEAAATVVVEGREAAMPEVVGSGGGEAEGERWW